MDILLAGNMSERKRGVPEHYFPPPIEPELGEGEQIVAYLSGMDITINEPEYALRIYSMGNYGTFVGQRMNFANLKCFESTSTRSSGNMMSGGENNDSSTIPMDSSFIAFDEDRAWISNKMGEGALHLSPMEAFYLFHEIGAIKLYGDKLNENSTADDIFNIFVSIFGHQFMRSYYVYKYFRRLGWIVRDGITFGVHFLLYKDAIDLHHSRAGVRIVDSILEPIVMDMAIHAAIRALNSCKKRLLLVAVEMPPATNNNIRLDDLEFAKIQVLSMNRWEINRSRKSDLE